MVRGRINQRGGKTHEEDCEEQVALGVAPCFAWIVPLLEAVNDCDNQRQNHGQHDDSQGPSAREADEAEALAAAQRPEEQAPHVHDWPYCVDNRGESRGVLEG